MQSDLSGTGNGTYQFAGGLMTILVDGAYTGGHYSLLFVSNPAGNISPAHSHDVDTETLAMVRGAINVETPGRWTVVNTGEVAVLLPGQVHRLSNTGEENANYLLLCSPPGFEQFVRRVGTRVVDAGASPRRMDQDDLRLLVSNAASYGVRLTQGTELLDPPSMEFPDTTNERFVAVGTAIEILSRFDDDMDGVVLIRATPLEPNSDAVNRRTSSSSAKARFFAGTPALKGSCTGTLPSSGDAVLLAVTTSRVLRLLREDCMSEFIISDDGPLGRLLLVLNALHATGQGGTVTSVPTASRLLPERRGLPIH